jgi:hypothetical protein
MIILLKDFKLFMISKLHKYKILISSKLFAILPTEESIIFTSKRGVILIQNGKLSFISSGDCLGISKEDDDIYFLECARFCGKIWKFNLTTKKKTLVVQDIPREIRQITKVENKIYMACVKENSIIYADLDTKQTHTLFISDTDVHPNSLTIVDNKIYCLFHNQYTKTQRLSRITVVNKDTGKEIEKIEVDGKCAHDILFHNEKMYFNNSLDGEVKTGSEVIAKVPGLFTRGLKVSEKGNIFFGADQSLPRHLRVDSNSYIFDLEGNMMYFVPHSGGVRDFIFL